ncbi:putative uncharacterized protein [Pseudomonas sp. StFLB209]|uniref:hypothetical protein n=1 Tax=Pseudomonas sp. StFLB209 TaxID=1028989 RepID=UPI0004F69974|nr:hypothetical protein [Pseudomonas sp. StFLB209]BAP44787.1 putative uncharacterized protein [Pseudomonas sp. StFLB209]
MKTPNSKDNAQLSAELADLDARMNAKESFAERVGLMPFAAGALAALIALIVAQSISHL